MSAVFVPERFRRKADVDRETLQRLLNENDQLIRCIVEYQNKGRATECAQYQQILHRNLVYLATLTDSCPEGIPLSFCTVSQGNICMSGNREVKGESSTAAATSGMVAKRV
ncbi:SS18-like protein 2 [Protopterus annectens]|uniref:SS18-like protein 2 n=1 Tax=Protopterus annectens TaxID=7888 RepID=UPI001CFB70D6|nr:SS18-like protein 2 [Protopterus annectens]